MPEFIHGLNGETLKERVEYLLKDQDLTNLRSISMDGSAFDSNQHVSLLRSVDGEFITQYKPRLFEIVKLILQKNSLYERDP